MDTKRSVLLASYVGASERGDKAGVYICTIKDTWMRMEEEKDWKKGFVVLVLWSCFLCLTCTNFCCLVGFYINEL